MAKVSKTPRRLRALLGDYPGTAAVKNGAVASTRVKLESVELKSVIDGFKPMIREQAFDVAELAAVSYLIAKEFEKPLVLLPIALTGRMPHERALYNANRGVLRPNDLTGSRIGVRSLTTTTGVWLRGILTNDYGVDLERIEWVTFEEAHVAEFRDGSTRAPTGRTILQMLLDGELDAVLGETSKDPRLAPLFGEPISAGEAWFRTHNVVPVNHVVVVKKVLQDSDPELVREVYFLLKRSHELSAGATRPPLGGAGMRRSLEMLINYAFEQKLISRKFELTELLGDLAPDIG